MKLIQILGTGCPKCEKLKKNAEEAIQELGVPSQGREGHRHQARSPASA